MRDILPPNGMRACVRVEHVTSNFWVISDNISKSVHRD